jgi:hypothetical protein
MFPIFYQVAEFCRRFSIVAEAETAAEAKKSAAHNDTDWQGFNNADAYSDEDDSTALMDGKPDPNNGHNAESGGSSSAAAADAGPSRRQRRGRGQADQQAAAAHGEGQGSFSRRKNVNQVEHPSRRTCRDTLPPECADSAAWGEGAWAVSVGCLEVARRRSYALYLTDGCSKGPCRTAAMCSASLTSLVRVGWLPNAARSSEIPHHI